MPYQNWKTLPPEQIPKLTITAYEQVVKDEDTKKKFICNYVALKKLYASASPRPEAYAIKNDLIFFDMIKKMIVKYSTERIRDINRELEYEITELILRSISAQEPIDPLTLMGEEKAKVSIFDDNFLAAFRKHATKKLGKIHTRQNHQRQNQNQNEHQPIPILPTLRCPHRPNRQIQRQTQNRRRNHRTTRKNRQRTPKTNRPRKTTKPHRTSATTQKSQTGTEKNTSKEKSEQP